MSLPFSGMGNLNIDILDSKNSGLQLFTRPEIDVSLLHGNDIQVVNNCMSDELYTPKNLKYGVKQDCFYL